MEFNVPLGPHPHKMNPLVIDGIKRKRFTFTQHINGDQWSLYTIYSFI